jgi:hypothetical protein
LLKAFTNVTEDAMADFGTGGTRKIHTYHAAILVSNGDYLDYTVKARGGRPEFVFSCAHRENITDAEHLPGHPAAIYSWTLHKTGPQPIPRPNAKPDFVGDAVPDDGFSVAMSFLGAIEYDLTINLCDSSGNLKQVVQDITYTSNAPEDSFIEPLVVTWR